MDGSVRKQFPKPKSRLTKSTFADGLEAIQSTNKGRINSIEGEIGKRGMYPVANLTPTRPAPLPPGALCAVSPSHAPPKPPRAFELSENSSSSLNRGVTPVPTPRCRVRPAVKSLLESDQLPFRINKEKDATTSLPVATPRCGKRGQSSIREKENFANNSNGGVVDEPISVSARRNEWQKKITNDTEKNMIKPPLLKTERPRSRLDDGGQLSGQFPFPAPRNREKFHSASDDELEMQRVTEDNAPTQSSVQLLREPLGASSPQNRDQSFRRNAKTTASLPAKATSARNKKRHAPLPPTNISGADSAPADQISSPFPETAPFASTQSYDLLNEIMHTGSYGLRYDVTDDRNSRCQNTETSIDTTDKAVSCIMSGTSKASVSLEKFEDDNQKGLHNDDDGGDCDDDYANESNIYCEIDEVCGPLSRNLKSSVDGSLVLEDEKQLHDLNSDAKIQVGELTSGKTLPVVIGTDVASRKPKMLSMSPKSPSNRRFTSRKPAVPTITIERHDGIFQEDDDDDDLPYVPDPHVKQQLQALQDLVSQELNVIHQTSNALTLCCHDFSAFSGSAEALECHRIILMACKKREAYLMEMQRLRETGGLGEGQGQGLKCVLTVRDIRLPLKSEFMSRIGSSFDSSVHHFIVMVRCGCQTFFTRMLSTHDAMVRSCLNFPDCFEMNVRQNSFALDLEVYGMSVDSNSGRDSPRKKKTRSVNPVRALTPSCTRRRLSSGNFLTTRSSNFINVASIRLNASQLVKTSFSLERIPISSPLQGSIHLCFSCETEKQIEECGFLTMFEEKSQIGTWHRRWFVLRNNRLSYWKYPDEETQKEPMGVVDLKFCVTDKVGFVSRSVCARPDTFELRLLKRPSAEGAATNAYRGSCDRSDAAVRLWLSADTKDERLTWCERLNDALANLRSWYKEAARPEKFSPIS